MSPPPSDSSRAVAYASAEALNGHFSCFQQWTPPRPSAHVALRANPRPTGINPRALSCVPPSPRVCIICAGAGHSAESPVAVGAQGGIDTSPRQVKKNNKWDTGAAKIGQGGFDADLNLRNYEATAQVAKEMKNRNQTGGGNFLAFGAENQEN